VFANVNAYHHLKYASNKQYKKLKHYTTTIHRHLLGLVGGTGFVDADLAIAISPFCFFFFLNSPTITINGIAFVLIILPRLVQLRLPVDGAVRHCSDQFLSVFYKYSLGDVIRTPSWLYARLCHAFLVVPL